MSFKEFIRSGQRYPISTKNRCLSLFLCLSVFLLLTGNSVIGMTNLLDGFQSDKKLGRRRNAFYSQGKRLGELSKYFSHILLLRHFLGLQNFFFPSPDQAKCLGFEVEDKGRAGYNDIEVPSMVFLFVKQNNSKRLLLPTVFIFEKEPYT